MAASHEVTRWLQQLDANDPATADRLFDIVYDELYGLAQHCFRNQPPNHTLQPTALVNEAFLRLIGQARVEWRSRAHFLAVAAKAMRRILIVYGVIAAWLARHSDIAASMAIASHPATDAVSANGGRHYDPHTSQSDSLTNRGTRLHYAQPTLAQFGLVILPTPAPNNAVNRNKERRRYRLQ